MKAYEVLKQYKNGRRDFRGENLQGQSFRDKDLSGADFSGADIRGANFTNANLKDVNFRGAKAGIQSRSAITLTFALCLLFALPAFLVSYPSTSIRAFLTSSNLADIFTGVVAIVVLEYLLLITSHEHFRDSTFRELCSNLGVILSFIFVVVVVAQILHFAPPIEELFLALFGAFSFVFIFTITGLISAIIFLFIRIINYTIHIFIMFIIKILFWFFLVFYYLPILGLIITNLQYKNFIKITYLDCLFSIILL